VSGRAIIRPGLCEDALDDDDQTVREIEKGEPDDIWAGGRGASDRFGISELRQRSFGAGMKLQCYGCSNVIAYTRWLFQRRSSPRTHLRDGADVAVTLARVYTIEAECRPRSPNRRFVRHYHGYDKPSATGARRARWDEQ
jgi:hypothetical protein